MIHIKYLLSILLFITSFSAFSNEYNEYIQCEGCSLETMKTKARAAVNQTGQKEILVFSTTTKTLRAFKVNTIVEDEPGTYIVRKVTNQLNVDPYLHSLFDEVSDTFNAIRAGKSVQYTGDNCPNSGCLTTTVGMGSVTSWLTANFGLPAYFHNSVVPILNKIFENSMSEYTIEVCFDDGVCVEFKFVTFFSSFGWKTTGPVNTSGGTTGDNSNGGVGGGFSGSMLRCTNWVTYKGTTADGTYCEGWSYN